MMPTQATLRTMLEDELGTLDNTLVMRGTYAESCLDHADFLRVDGVKGSIVVDGFVWDLP